MTELVVDASALVELVLRTEVGEQVAESLIGGEFELHIPALCDVEFASILRGLSLAGRVGDQRLREAAEDYRALPLERHGHAPLLDEILRLRHNFSAYDATYVVLAADLGMMLMTADPALGRAIEQTESVHVATWVIAS